MDHFRAGLKDKLVSVQKKTETAGAEGGIIEDWTTENQMWARINPVRAKEGVDADQVKNVVSHRITMDFYSPGITGADRITWNSRTFNIISVVNVGELDCDTVLDVLEAEVV